MVGVGGGEGGGQREEGEVVDGGCVCWDGPGEVLGWVGGGHCLEVFGVVVVVVVVVRVSWWWWWVAVFVSLLFSSRYERMLVFFCTLQLVSGVLLVFGGVSTFFAGFGGWSGCGDGSVDFKAG